MTTEQLVDAIRRKIEAQLTDLDPGEVPPTPKATERWEQHLGQATTSSTSVPIVSVLGDGGLRFTWRNQNRRLFLTVYPDGRMRQRQLRMAHGRSTDAEPIADPTVGDTRRAINWVHRL